MPRCVGPFLLLLLFAPAISSAQRMTIPADSRARLLGAEVLLVERSGLAIDIRVLGEGSKSLSSLHVELDRSVAPQRVEVRYQSPKAALVITLRQDSGDRALEA